MLNMEAQIITRKLVKPSVPTPPHRRNLKLSFIDQLAPPNYATTIFYYSANANSDQLQNTTEIFTQLEKSLSETLTLFYPLAGRHIKNDLFMHCNDEGVQYLEARVNGEMSQLLCGETKPELLDLLVPNLCDFAIVAIQINIFECGGVAIGLRNSHRIADRSTTSAFVHGWAAACRGEINEVIWPSFKLASLFPSRDLSGLMPLPPRKNDENIVTKVFVFDKAAISTLKTKASAGGSCNGDLGATSRPSRVEVVTALIWKALIGAARAKHGHLRASLLCHIVNFRGKIPNLPIPKHSCGNLYRLAIARFTPNERNLELHVLVVLIKDAIRNAIAESARAMHCDDVFSMVFNSRKELNEGICNGEVDVCKFTSLCRFPLYETDFGWGKPIWVSLANLERETVVLMDTKCGDGIEAWVSLFAEKMVHFQQDKDLLVCLSQ